MNAEALRQYRKNQRRRAKVYRGKAMPRLHHLVQEGRAFVEPIWKPMPNPTPVSAFSFSQEFLKLVGHLAAIPFLKRREKEWRK
jgi:hypothetical protein